MKKALALVLAVMMLATIAFAAVDVRVEPGKKLKFAIYKDGSLNAATGGFSNAAGGVTATTVSVDIKGTAPTGDYFTKELSGTYYSVSSVKWDKGAALVNSVTINNDGELVIELKKDYTLEADIVAATPKGKLLEGSFKINEKASNKSVSYEIGKSTGTNIIYVGYILNTTALALNPNGTADLTPSSANIYKVVKYDATTTDAAVSYDSVIIVDDMGNEVLVRLYDGEKFYLASDTDANLDVVKKYDDADADLRFISWPAKPTFSSTATYSFFTADEDDIIYAIGANGALTASGAKWSDDDGCWVLKTRTLGAYVISDKKLSTATTDSTTPIPDTGANDVVGIATALAVVALVSAAAVSLKK